MQQRLIECVPNFSEARRPEVVEAIIQAMSRIPEVYILDRHSDADHNRTVVTLIGSPEGIEEAAFQGIAAAAKLIDLNKHTGVHPRIGATDVVPIIPISGVSMAECVEASRRLGERVGRELNIPVYLYEQSATRPERQKLENVRRGQYEGLKTEIEINPDRTPDYGPRTLGPAGATAIGARQPLIAFNVYLNTDDTSIAKKIAKAVRQSSGGLPYVKAMGVLVRGNAQVSMNLTDYRQTPISRVFEMVSREASHHGVSVTHSELVGLIPQDALIDAAKVHLHLDDLQPAQVLENRIFEVMGAQTDFLEELASGEPVPAGGSASAYAGATAAALVAKAARVTIGKKPYRDVEHQMVKIRDRADQLRVDLARAVALDAAAYQGYINAARLPGKTPEEKTARKEAIRQARTTTVSVPLETAEKAVGVMELAVKAARWGNINAIADAAAAGYLAEACYRGTSLNIRVNARGFEDQTEMVPFLEQLAALDKQITDLSITLQNILKERGQLTF